MHGSGPHMHRSTRRCMSEERLIPLLLPSLHQWRTCVFSIVFLDSSSTESTPVIICQISRLRTLRARATDPARDANLRRGVHGLPLRAP